MSCNLEVLQNCLFEIGSLHSLHCSRSLSRHATVLVGGVLRDERQRTTARETKAMSTLYRITLVPAPKTYRIGLSFTHKTPISDLFLCWSDAALLRS